MWFQARSGAFAVYVYPLAALGTVPLQAMGKV